MYLLAIMADETGRSQNTKTVSTKDALVHTVPHCSSLHILQPLHQATSKQILINYTPQPPRRKWVLQKTCLLHEAKLIYVVCKPLVVRFIDSSFIELQTC
jgi:hypothetical protein